MKIIQLFYYPGQGGAEQYAYLLAKEAKKDGHKTIFIFSEDGPLVTRVKELGCEVKYVKMRSPFDPIAVKELVTIFKAEIPDVVQTHFLRENFLTIAASKFAPVGAIFTTVHRLEPKTNVQALFNRFYSNGLTKFIAVSDLAKQYLEKEGINPHKIVVIPNGAEIEKFNKEKVRKELGVTKEKIITYVGRFTHEKGHDTLLKAFKELDLKNTKLILVGEGEERPKYEKLAQRLGLEKSVIFTGARDKGYQIIGISDVYVQPSKIENMPISVIEAMLQKIPIVASDNEAHEAILKNGLHGELFKNKSYKDLAKKLKVVLTDDKPTKDKAKKGFDYAKERFTAEIMWTKTRGLYEHALKVAGLKK